MLLSMACSNPVLTGNCLIDASGTLKLTDFGLSRLLDAPRARRQAVRSTHTTVNDVASCRLTDEPEEMTSAAPTSFLAARGGSRDTGRPSLLASVSLSTEVADWAAMMTIPMSQQHAPHTLASAAAPLMGEHEQCQLPTESCGSLPSLRMLTQNVGTAQFAAPEVLRLSSDTSEPAYTLSADIYSIGVLLWTLASREKPWESMLPVQIIQAVKAGQRPPAPAETCPEGWRQLVLSCWAQTPHKRPAIDQVCEVLANIHGPIQDIDETQTV